MSFTVLIVDDSETVRRKLGKAVSALGYLPSFANDGELALKHVGDQEVDIILLDIEMPGLDGFQVLERLKSNPHTRHIPVIIISAIEDRMSNVVRGLEMGAEDFLPKEFEAALLKARLSAGISKKRLHDIEKDYLRLVLDWVPAGS